MSARTYTYSSGKPGQGLFGSSGEMRVEFTAIEAGFNAAEAEIDALDAAKPDLSGGVYTGTHNFTGATVTVAAPTATTHPATKAYVDATAFSSELPGQAGHAGEFVTTDGSNASWAAVLPSQTGKSGQRLSTNGTTVAWAIDQRILSSRTSNTILGLADSGSFIDVTSGTFTQTFAAAATLTSGWNVVYRNSGTGDITLDPDGSEQIDGLTSFIMYPGECRFIQCDGSKLTSIVLSALTRTFTVDGHASGNLSALDVSGTQIHNIGQGANDVNLALPAAAPGLSAVFQVGEPSANYWRITTPTAGYMIVDGVVGKTYAQLSAPNTGDFFIARAAKAAPPPAGILTGAALAIGTTNTAVASGAFTYYIAGIKYAKASAAAGTAPGNDVIPRGKYGAVALDIDAAGAITVVEAAANATGYDTPALAIAGLAAVADTKARMGTVTAMKSNGTFTFGTTALDAANTTVAYTSAPAYSAVYCWIVTSGAGVLTSG